MKRSWLLVAGLALALGGASATAQKPQPDYLTPEEVEQVRQTQEPNQRVELFLQFANQRLSLFEQTLSPAPDRPPTRPEVLRDLLNNFVRALDDATEALDQPLERGGADLRKARTGVTKRGEDFLKRLDHIRQTEAGASEDFRYDLEDAVEATRDLLETAKKIPDEPIPPKSPASVTATTPTEREAPPGRPTLKRREEKKPK